jgi:hypothetical protein
MVLPQARGARHPRGAPTTLTSKHALAVVAQGRDVIDDEPCEAGADHNDAMAAQAR